MTTMEEEEEDWVHHDTQLEEGVDGGNGASDGNETIADDDDDEEVADDISVVETQLVAEDTQCDFEPTSPNSNINAPARQEEVMELARAAALNGEAGISFTACNGANREPAAREQHSPVPRPPETAREAATMALTVQQQHPTEDSERTQTQDCDDEGLGAGGPSALNATTLDTARQRRRGTPGVEGAGSEGVQAEPHSDADGEDGDGGDHDDDDGGEGLNRKGFAPAGPGRVEQANDLTPAGDSEIRPTLEDSPSLRSPSADDAASANRRDNHSPQGRESTQYTEVRSLGLSPAPEDSSIPPRRREQTASPELAPATPTSGRREGGDADNSESSGGLSQLCVAPPSLLGVSPRSDEAVERRPPSPPRRTGHGSGVFLRRGGGEPTPRGASAASVGGCSAREGSGASPVSPSIPGSSHGKTGRTESEELVASPRAPSAMSSTLSTVVSPLEPTAASGGVTVGDVATGTPPGSESAGQTRRLMDDMPATTGEGDSVGFLSSADPPAKADDAVTSAPSSPQPLPRGWLDKELAAAAAHSSPPSRARRARVEDGERGRERNEDTRQPPPDAAAAAAAAANKQTSVIDLTAAPNPIVTPVTKAPKIPSSIKAVPGPGGWIQTKVSQSRGGKVPAAGAGRGGGGCARATADSQERSLSQNILAIGVPEDRCVSVRRSRPARAAGADDEDRDPQDCGLSQFREEEDDDGGTPAGMVLSLNTQDINPNDFSQIQKDCSQDRKEVERLLDQAIAEGQCLESAGNADANESMSSCPPPVGAERIGTNAVPGTRGGLSHAGPANQDADRGGGGSVEAGWHGRNALPAAKKRKSMKTSVGAVARGADAIGGPEERRGRGGAVSRTPGMHMGGSASKLSAKKKAALTNCPSRPGPAQQAKNVFDLPSDDDASDSAPDDPRGRCVISPAVARSANSKKYRRESSGGGKASDSSPPTRAVKHAGVAGRRGDGLAGGGPDDTESGGASNANARDVPEDDDDDADGEVVRTEEDLQMARAMAAIRNDLSPSPSTPRQNEHEDKDREGEEGGGGEGGYDKVEVVGTVVEGEEDNVDEPGVTALRRLRAEPGRTRVAAGSSRRRHAASNQARADRDGVDRGIRLPSPRTEKCAQSHTGKSAPSRSTTVSNNKSSVGKKTAPLASERAERGGGGDAAAGATSTAAVGATPVTYNALLPFLDKEGWECVDGKGLHTWFYLFPGKGGRNGKAGVDFLVSEEEVVEHVCTDKHLLARFEEHRRETARGSPSGSGGGGGGGGGNGGGGGSGYCLGDESPAHAERCKRGVGDHVGGCGRSGRKIARPPVVANSKRGKKKNGDEVGGSFITGKGKHRAGGRAAERDPRKVLEEETGPEKQWPALWPKLQEVGWHWEFGSGLAPRIWLKKGVSKRSGVLGVDMFESEEAVMEHVTGGAAAGGQADDGAAAQGKGMGEVVGREPRIQEWGLTKNRSKRQRCQPTFLGDTPPPEVIKLPSRKARRKTTAASPAAFAAKGPSAVTAQAKTRGDDEQSAAGAHDRQFVPQAQRGVSKRPPKCPQRDAPPPPSKRGREQRKKPPSRVLCNDVGGEGGGEGLAEIDDAALSEEEMDVATQPQYALPRPPEIDMADDMAGVEQARDADNPHAAATGAAGTAAVAAGFGVGGGGARCGPAGSDGNALSAVDKARSTDRGVRDTSAVKSTRSASQRPPVKAAPGGVTVAATSSSGAAVGGGCNGDVGDGGVDRTPSRQEGQAIIATPPTSTAAGCGGGGGGGGGSGTCSGSGTRNIKKRRGSPPAGNTLRASSRRQGPFSGLGVIITGFRREGPNGSGAEIEGKIKKLGGQLVQVHEKNVAGSDEWREWLLNKAGQSGCGGGSGSRGSGGSGGGSGDGLPQSDDGRRMIAVATHDSDRTQKFQLALAAGIPIVHPSYVIACSRMVTELDPTPHLLPLGRSALGDRGLIMPFHSAVPGGGDLAERGSALPGDRPFHGKHVLLYMGESASASNTDKWVFTLSVAGATVTTLDTSSDGTSGGGGGAGRRGEKAAAATGDGGSRCTLEAALDLVQKGLIHCVIGPNSSDGFGARTDVPPSRNRLEIATVKAGTAAGTFEWAVQCMAHRRLLLPNASTCPWFPLCASVGGGGSGGGSGNGRTKGASEDADEAANAPSSRVGGKNKKRKGRGGPGGRGRGGSATRGTTSEATSSGEEGGPFHVHASDGGKRYLAGDYVLLAKEKRATKAGAATVGRAGAAVDAANRPRVVRIQHFERDGDGKLGVWVTAMERGDDGSKVLVARGTERVGETMLGGRVLAMTRREMERTQIYSTKDEGIFCLSEEGDEQY